jgi:glycosyltransferase 2 family protein
MRKNAEVISKKGQIVKKLIIGIIVGIGVFSLFFLWGDVQSVKYVISSIPLHFIGLAIIFTLLSYFLRFAKWHYFLTFLEVKVSARDSLSIFFIGLSMSITPGKIGELLKSYLIKNISGTNISKSASAVFVDRLTDLFAMIILVSIGLTVFSYSYIPILIFTCSLLLLVVLLRSKVMSTKIIYRITSVKTFSKYKEILQDLYDSLYELIHYRLLFFTTLISTVAWFMECISLYILIKALALPLGLLESTFIFSLGTVAGALSMLPGGLGIAEGSITGMLMNFQIEKSVAVSITLLIRLVTLWLGVIIGLIIFFKKRKDYML